MDAFARKWEDLLRAFPEARRKAVETMGEAARRQLNEQIQAAQLKDGAKGTVRSWQELRLGSGGGYAALSPRKGVARPAPGERQHTWHGSPVTQRQVTRWLEKGHGVRKPTAGSGKAWNQAGRGGRIKQRSARTYVAGRQFYSWTEEKALELARKAADQALSLITDEGKD